MKILTNRITWGLLLLTAGVLFLLQNINLLPGGEIFWFSFFILIGLYFLFLFFSGLHLWWAAFPGFSSLAIAMILGLQEFGPTDFREEWLGAGFLGFLALGFFAVYLKSRTMIWAVLPGGILFSLAVFIIFADLAIPGLETGSVLLFGIGLTFLVLSVLRSPSGRNRWALWPGFAIIGAGVLVSLNDLNLLQYLLPLGLILFGAAILLRSLLKK